MDAVIVDHICYGVDQLDGQLCTSITGSCLCTENEGSRIEVSSPDVL